MIKDKEYTMCKIKKLLALLVLTAASAGCGQAWGMDQKGESLYPSLETDNKLYNQPPILNNYDDGNSNNYESIYPILNDNKIMKKTGKKCVVFSFVKNSGSDQADSIVVLLKKDKNTHTLPTGGDLDVLKAIINQFIIRTIDATTYLAKPLEENMLFEDFSWVKVADHTKENDFSPNWSDVTNLLKNQKLSNKIGSAWDALGKGIGEPNKNEKILDEQENKIEKYKKIEKNEKLKEESVNKNALILEIAPESDGEIKINAVLVENSDAIIKSFDVQKTTFEGIYTTGAGNNKLKKLQKYPFATAWPESQSYYLIAFEKNCWEDGLDAFEKRFISNTNLLSDILVDHENPLKENEDIVPQQSSSSYFSNIFSQVSGLFGYKNDK